MPRVHTARLFGLALLLTACQIGGYGRFSPALDLTQAVEEALMANDELAVSRIHVETQGDTVILSGYVKKIRQSDNAEQIARGVRGVQAVENHIIVKP